MTAGGCAICGADAATRVLDLRSTDTADRFCIERCRGCGVLRTVPVPDDLSPHYATDLAATMTHAGSRLFSAAKGARLALEARRLRRRAPPGPLLDIGCGTGDFALAASRQGYRVFAADHGATPPPDVAAAPHIAYLRFDFEAYEILDSHPGGPYTVVLRHVLEHARDPLRMLQRLREEGGRTFYIVVPNAGSRERRLLGRYWYLWDPPRHLWHFEHATLDRLCRQAGLVTLARGTATAPTLVPSLYRYLRLHGGAERLYRHLGPNSAITALTAPLNLTLPGNVLWRIVEAEN